MKIIKGLRDANTECTLRVVQSSILDNASNIEDVNISQLIYARPTPKTVEQFEVCKLLMNTLEEQKQLEFCEQRIYKEYFENRFDLIELYLDCVTRILEQQVNLHSYISVFLSKYSDLMTLESHYFHQQFSFTERFQQFCRENEYEMLHQRLRPHIVGCTDIQSLCDTIDLLKNMASDRGIVSESSLMSLYSDVQERLLLISHYQIQSLLAP